MDESDKLDGSVQSENRRIEDILFTFLTNNRTLLSKSLLQEVRAAKQKDMKRLVKIYSAHGIARNPKQIRKAINNLRNRVKTKASKNRMGRTKEFSPLEQRFVELLVEPVTYSTTTDPDVSSEDLQSPQKTSAPSPTGDISSDGLRLKASVSPTPPPPPLFDLHRDGPPSPSSNMSFIWNRSLSDSRENVLDMQMKVAEAQMEVADVQRKAADAQYLAAVQQRMYYELKIQQLRGGHL